MKKLFSILLLLAVVIACIAALPGTATAAETGTTSSTNYTKLRSYINTYGVTASNGTKWIYNRTNTTDGWIRCALYNTDSGIKFEFMYQTNDAYGVCPSLYFYLTDSSKYLSVVIPNSSVFISPDFKSLIILLNAS